MSPFDQLATLAPALSFVAPAEIPPHGYRWGLVTGNQLVCCDAAGVFVFDLTSGELVRRMRIRDGLEVRVVDGGYVVTVRDKGKILGGRLVHLPLDDSPAQVVPYRGQVKSWSPDDTELAIFDHGRFEIVRWPSMSVVASAFGHHPTLDWDARLMLFTDGERHVVQPFDANRERRYIAYDKGKPQWLYPLGNGVVDINFGFTLLSLSSGWRTDLVDELPDESFISPHVTPDGRGIRAVVANRPCRIDIDLATGQLRSRFEIPADGVGEDDEVWHPHLDAAIVENFGSPILRAIDGRVLARFPDSADAKCWFDDGRALLLTYPDSDANRLQIDVWRCSSTS